MLKVKIKRIIDRNSKFNWISNVPTNSVVLDIGCGNDSALKLKSVRGDIVYHGIDIADYNLSNEGKLAMDEYFLFFRESFLEELESLPFEYDCVILSHVLEHVPNPNGLIISITKKLKTCGLLFLSFPAMETVNFPKRNWTLNFYDDNTHVSLIDPYALIEKLSSDYIVKKFIPRNTGGVLTKLSAICLDRLTGAFGRNNFLTWYRWGFEVIIQLQKK
jgi:2-polyprenyl-3-methyl-5-hydroxy-6-metoxy-1,4-benzoquinol methylase